MSQLLRRPQAVPSLFSQGSDHDNVARRVGGLPSPVANRLEAWALALGLQGEDTIIGRSSRAIAASSIAIFMIGLPLVKATTLVVSLSMAH
jgi:hypothetical protein